MGGHIGGAQYFIEKGLGAVEVREDVHSGRPFTGTFHYHYIVCPFADTISFLQADKRFKMLRLLGLAEGDKELWEAEKKFIGPTNFGVDFGGAAYTIARRDAYAKMVREAASWRP